MFTQKASARTRSRLATTLVALALTAAVLVIASEASSIKSTKIGPQAAWASAQAGLTAKRYLQTRSIHIPKDCWRRKFGCALAETTAAKPDLQTSIQIPKGCTRRKFGCGYDPTSTANRP